MLLGAPLLAIGAPRSMALLAIFAALLLSRHLGHD
jgi:hypothetical protein